jgi:hypothetical protein
VRSWEVGGREVVIGLPWANTTSREGAAERGSSFPVGESHVFN